MVSTIRLWQSSETIQDNIGHSLESRIFRTFNHARAASVCCFVAKSVDLDIHDGPYPLSGPDGYQYSTGFDV